VKYLIFLILSAYSLVAAAELPVFELTIENHRFTPDKIVIPADAKVKLLVKNRDTTPEEFESHELNREKMIPPSKEVTIYIGPLDPGEYGFFGEFNEDTARGKIIVE
jgi:plastocyanin domain-containing protein